MKFFQFILKKAVIPNRNKNITYYPHISSVQYYFITLYNLIEYITTATLGNAADFGDRTVATAPYYGGGNAIRGIWAGGQDPSAVNTIDYATISTLGNAVDFGDATSGRNNAATFSNGHGGL